MEATELVGIEITVDVTEDDLRSGKMGNAADCPFARAFRRALIALGFDDFTRLEVWYNEIVIVDTHFAVPNNVQTFIREFDNVDAQTTPVGPQSLTFTLELI